MGIANFKYINDAVASKPRIAFWIIVLTMLTKYR